MTVKDNLVQSVAAGAVIKPWIMLGAYNIDVSNRVVGLTYFEGTLTAPTQVGYALIDAAADESRAILASTPCEGDAGVFFGQSGQWSLVRGPEEYLTWGTYNIKNHLGAALLSTVLSPQTPGRRHWRLYTRIQQRVLVAVNGKVIYDNENSKGVVNEGVNQYDFEAELSAGENRVSVVLLRVARMAQVGLRLECLDSDLTAQAPLPAGMSFETRLAVEEELGSIRLERDIFYPEHAVGFNLGQAPSAAPGAPRLEVELRDPINQRSYTRQPSGAGLVQLCQSSDLPDNVFQINCSWKLETGKTLTGTSFAIHKVSPKTPPSGYEALPERRQLVLEHYANNIEREVHGIWTEVARYALGQYDRVDLNRIRATCQFITARNDCADFVIQGILRLMWWERSGHHLPAEINALMKDAVLGFKYWVDEPGDTVMYMGSENHRLLFHVAEWMAGLLFPVEEFTNSRQNGLFHSQKAYVYITEWLRQRGRYGFDEWHSNSYLPVNIAPLMNVYDFAMHEGQHKLRQMTGMVLDQIFFYLAADSYNGFWGTSHGRSYGIYIKYADFDGVASMNWLLYATGALTIGTRGMGAVMLASSAYKPPRLFYDIANDHSAVVECKQRQGISRTTARNANFVVYRTPDYMLSGTQDHRKGEAEGSTHIAHITLANKAQVFWSCPHTAGEGSGQRPDYWSGNTILPRVIQHKNVLMLHWRLSKFAWMSHCWLEPARFDQVELDGSWAFARSGQGYLAIYSQHGLAWGEDGQYAGRELQCRARENTWIAECGRQADWGSFEAFCAAMKAAKIEERDGRIYYQSPSIGEFVSGWDGQPSVAGETIQIGRYPLYDSPWAHADFGAGEFNIHYNDQEYDLWLNQ